MSKAAFPKTDRLREMREERHKEDISQGKRIVKALRQAVEHARGNTELATTHIVTVPAVVAGLNAAAAAIGGKGGKSKSPAKIAAAKQSNELSNTQSNTVSNTEAFDKRAYQREYMRKRRLKSNG